MRYFRLLKLLSRSGWFAILLCCAAPVARAGLEPDFLMNSDPELHLPEPVKDFDPNLASLWMTALERAEVDLQRMAA